MIVGFILMYWICLLCALIVVLTDDPKKRKLGMIGFVSFLVPFIAGSYYFGV